jgi:hypothetical protein
MSNREAIIYAQTLDAAEQGEQALEAFLEQVPDMKDELAEMLDLVELYRECPVPPIDPQFQYAARARLMNRLAAPQPLSLRRRLQLFFLNVFSFRTSKFAIALVLLAVLMVSLLGVGTVQAAQGSLPGDRLYSLKLAIEDIRLTFASEAAAARLMQQFASARIAEVQALVELGRYQDIPKALARYEQLVARGGRQMGAEMARYIEVLTGLLAQVPEEFRPAIEHAILVSVEHQPLGPVEEAPPVAGPTPTLAQNLPAAVPSAFPTASPSSLPPAISTPAPTIDPNYAPILVPTEDLPAQTEPPQITPDDNEEPHKTEKPPKPIKTKKPLPVPTRRPVTPPNTNP